MKAAIYREYGGPEVLKIEEVDKPTPGPKEILIKIYSTPVTSGDWRLRKADPFAVRLFFGLFKPRKNILGGSFAGIVEDIGKDVTQFNPGDKIFGSTGMKLGTYAEYKSMPEKGIVCPIPEGVSYEQATVIPFGPGTALHFIRKAKVKPGQKVLIYGASGSVGSAAVQLAKHFGAEVTGVCSTANLELVKSLGADHVIDYTKEDFSKNKGEYDVIFDSVGKSSFWDALKSVKKGGRLALGSANFSQTLLGALISPISSKKVISGVMKETSEDMNFLMGLMLQGVLKPTIEKTYGLNEIREAHAHAETGHKKGNIVINISN
jgi:NADPH:quinone reductase-like Zn-dependent oxidoreductase